MNVRESVGMALGALRANKLRSLLTLLGVIIGVSSVIAVMSVVQGLNRYMSEKLIGAGANVFSVDRVGIEFDFTKVREKLRRRRLTAEDAGAIARAATNVDGVSASRDETATLRRGSQAMRRVFVHGVEPGYDRVEDYPVETGRPIGSGDDRRRAFVCVLGPDAVQELFGPLDPIGRVLRVGDAAFTVVGVGKRKGSAFGQSQDGYVLIPLATFDRLWGRQGSVTIAVRSRGRETFETAQDEARAILRARRHIAPGAPDDFEIVTPDMYLSLWSNLSGAIFIVFVGVSLLSQLVGGIVIMNIMLVSVTERTREIGIRKAVGARRRDVLLQFLIEAVTLSLTGGVLGLALGGLFAVVLGLATPLPTFVSPLSVVLGLGSSVLVGVFFGAYPASRAARLDPIESLRFE